MTYESFAKELLSRGYSWDEVEYYWRNPEELNRMENDEEIEIEENQTSKDIKSNIVGGIAIGICILFGLMLIIIGG